MGLYLMFGYRQDSGIFRVWFRGFTVYLEKKYVTNITVKRILCTMFNIDSYTNL